MLGIVVRSWNAYEYTKLTLQCLLENTVGDFTIVVVDNGSTLENLIKLRNICKSSSKISLIENGENLGVSKATNIGINSLKTDMVCIIDNDVLVPYGWNTVLIDEMDTYGISVIGPNRFTGLHDPDSGIALRELWNTTKISGGDPEDLFMRFSKNRDITSFSEYIIKNNNRVFSLIESPPGFISGSLMVFKRDICEKVGGFGNADYDLYGAEDVDFCWRVGISGYKIGRSGKVYVHHFEGSSIANNNLDIKSKMSINNKKLLSRWADTLREYTKTNENNIEELKDRHPFIKVFLGEIEYF
jgi:GT2 family glycosyltransferase